MRPIHPEEGNPGKRTRGSGYEERQGGGWGEGERNRTLEYKGEGGCKQKDWLEAAVGLPGMSCRLLHEQTGGRQFALVERSAACAAPAIPV